MTVAETMSPSEHDFNAKLSQKYIDFTYENPTPYHVVEHYHKELELKGFTYLPETKNWNGQLTKPGRYFTKRSGTCLMAFVIGPDWQPSKGIACIGSHIDAITTKLKPVSKKPKEEGYELLGVTNVRVALSDKWWDRDLGIGGRVLVKSQNSDGSSRTFAKLINSAPHAIAHVASPAPHLIDEDTVFNPETEKVPIIGFDLEGDEELPSEDEKKCHLFGKHSLKLLRFIAKLAEVKVSELYAIDLDLYDIQRGTFAGLDDEFICAPRMDDKICGFAAMESLISLSETPEKLPQDTFSSVALLDNEEIGSLTRQGAQGKIINAVVDRVLSALNFKTSLRSQLFAQSVLLSSDVTHLFNPNFEEIYLKNHRAAPNTGIVVDLDPNGHMSTDNVGLLLMEMILEKHGHVIQYSQVRNDMRSGNTIGPMISAATGARTIEIGIAQLSMHSIRAMCGTEDIGIAVKFFKSFFQAWRDCYDSVVDLLN